MRIEPGLTLISTFVVNWWTPIFVALFVAVLVYALWPRNRATFDHAAKMPLRED
ncbi:MAG: cbb3-type cytochrome c oxidase subunit 3 [Rhodoplanes sp.]|uniref:cbb3-type cytochrome c oxidase subunit 3 n=1 Tax=Rhodoplanes sp. TaxID=1968906 RepID=UPI00184392B6|nr:cbb3-type cytochrome c oxidase subunit 3 [Rhodoplanes sp.]NVO15613.1 cbb3-type cytochrome c oxidase subunit 3 [Rhodoplanes sp.]